MAEWLVLPLAFQQVEVPFALQQGWFEGWDHELNGQSGEIVGDWDQGVVEVCR